MTADNKRDLVMGAIAIGFCAALFLLFDGGGRPPAADLSCDIPGAVFPRENARAEIWAIDLRDPDVRAPTIDPKGASVLMINNNGQLVMHAGAVTDSVFWLDRGIPCQP